MSDLAAVAATELNNNKPVNIPVQRSSTPGSVHGDSNSGFQTPSSVISGRSSVSPNPVATSRPQLKVVIPPSSRSSSHMVSGEVTVWTFHELSEGSPWKDCGKMQPFILVALKFLNS